MSAICGLWNRDGRPGAGGDCARMRRALAIYGSDRSAQWDGEEIALGVQLARLLPEDRFDRQPLAAAGGRFQILADVRLDNRPELAAALSLPAAMQMADADYVRVAWETWGEACLDRLIGDFALAVWDGHARCLHLARDMMGRRPLFYHCGAGFVAFATMAKGLHALPEVPRAADLDTLRDYLALAPMRGAGSFFAGISRVEPGALVTLHADGQVHARDWYDWLSPHAIRAARPADHVEALRATFDRAVSDRLRAVGPIASGLSGGLDSSAVAVTAAGLLAARGQRLTAYTHVPLRGVPLHVNAWRVGDEWPLAAETAATCPNIDHVAVEAADRAIGDDLDAHFHHFEYPALNLCNQVWISEIGRQARRRGDVVLLSGAMGNMTISQTGYERLPELFWQGKLSTWASEVAALRRRGHTLLNLVGGRTLLPALPFVLARALQRLRGPAPPDLAEFSALQGSVREGEALRTRMRETGYAPGQPWRDRAEVARFVLRRADHAALVAKGSLCAFGIDPRDPTADRRLVELTQALPSSAYLQGGQTKWIYHQAFADRIPAAVREDVRRGLQAADWPERLRVALPDLQQRLADARTSPSARSLMDMESLTAMAQAGLPPGPPTRATMTAYRLRLLRGVSVAHFIRRLDQGNAAPGDRLDPMAPARPLETG